MKARWIAGGVLALACVPFAWAQAADDAPPATTHAAAQQLMQDQQRLMRDEQKMRQDQQRLYQQEFDPGQEQINRQMLEARRQMQAAAQRMAELTMQMSGPMLSQLSHQFDPDRAVLGVTIVNVTPAQNAAGVRVEAVTPGGPAARGGLRAGDVITSINGTAFAANSPESAADQLMDLMGRVKPGEDLTLDYLRNGRAHVAHVTAGRLADYGFTMNMPGMPAAQPANMRAIFGPWGYLGRVGPWAGMQLVPLTPNLGQYFGTSHGLLVVRAPSNPALKLDDGDVILKIGDREPASPSDAMRIIYSYGPGDALALHILRKKKPLSLAITVPQASESGPYRPMNPSDR